MSPKAARLDATEVRRLARDIDGVPARAVGKFLRVVAKNSDRIVDGAKANARKTARRHGKLYPRTFGYDQRGLTSFIGPDASLPQGGMEFEYGRQQTAPHLDFNRAADDVEYLFRNDVYQAAHDAMDETIGRGGPR